MKKLIAAVGCALLLSACGANQPNETGDCTTLKLFSPGEYISSDIIPAFEKQYKVRVIHDLFASNEEMYTKLLTGDTYDVLVPSDYMIERLIQEDRLQALDWSQIPNRANLIETLKNQSFDEGDVYSAPYFWGTVGIIYNTKKVSSADVESQGWNVFRNETYKGRVYFYDSERDAFMIALKALGYSVNTSNDQEIQKASEWLTAFAKTMNPVYVTDEVIDHMIGGVKDLAYVYSGDAAYMMSENEDLAFSNPSQGTNVWTDSMVIPSNAKCPALAHTWINYLLENEVGYENTLYVGYTSPLQEVFDEVSQDEEEGFGGIDAYVPRVGYEKDEVFRYNEEQRKKVSELWTIIKANQ